MICNFGRIIKTTTLCRYISVGCGVISRLPGWKCWGWRFITCSTPFFDHLMLSSFITSMLTLLRPDRQIFTLHIAEIRKFNMKYILLKLGSAYYIQKQPWVCTLTVALSVGKQSSPYYQAFPKREKSQPLYQSKMKNLILCSCLNSNEHYENGVSLKELNLS